MEKLALFAKVFGAQNLSHIERQDYLGQNNSYNCLLNIEAVFRKMNCANSIQIVKNFAHLKTKYFINYRFAFNLHYSQTRRTGKPCLPHSFGFYPACE